MNQETKEALKEFFSSQIKLHRLGIILSRDYIGDIGKVVKMSVYDNPIVNVEGRISTSFNEPNVCWNDVEYVNITREYKLKRILK